MTEKELINETGTDVVDNTDYIAAINELKQNSVDRAKYDQLKADNKRLLDSIVNGQTVDVPAPKTIADLKELRSKLFKNENQTNLEYVTNALALRDALIENGEADPFLPTGKKIVPTDDDIATAERVANVLKECVEYAEGDSDIFTNELMRRTVDTGPVKKRK